jgi:hypothetical protein
MNFWGFANEHPYAAVIMTGIIAWAVVVIARMIIVDEYCECD